MIVQDIAACQAAQTPGDVGWIAETGAAAWDYLKLEANSSAIITTFRVIIFASVLDHDLGLSKRIENFSIHKFMSLSCVEAFTISLFQKICERSVRYFWPDGWEPVLNPFCNKPGSIFWTNIFEGAAYDEQIIRKSCDWYWVQFLTNPDCRDLLR